MEEHDREKRCCTKLKARLSSFDKYVFSPLFIKDEGKMARRDGRLEDLDDWKTSSTHRSKS
jgi:hypothetical protein